MFQQGLRRLRRDERGQALVLGAVAMLIVAIAVLSTVSIGHGIYAKMKLQDAADAQSYSIAVKEARAYNFLAYTNRAMVVHYNAMLTVMAYVSHAFYLQKTIGNIAGVLKYLPGIGGVFSAIQQVIKSWMDLVDGLSRLLVPLLTALNVALWLAQEAVVTATLLDLATSTSSLVLQNTDPHARIGDAMNAPTILGRTLNFDNTKNFIHLFDDGNSMKLSTGAATRARLLKDNALSDPKMAKYRLLMGSIVNASRREWTAVGQGPKLVGRRWNLNVFCLVKFKKEAVGELRSFDEHFRGNLKDQLFAEDSVSLKIKPCVGKTIFSFDYTMSVQADLQNGGHRTRLSLGGPLNIDTPLDARHHKFHGITPFFASDPSYIRPHLNHFGYPCNVVIATRDMIGTQRRFELQNDSMQGQGTLEGSGVLDMTWEKVGGPELKRFRNRTGGMMVASVGRAIYHRPGEWKEAPNFFNPLWTARLAPLRTHWERPIETNAELQLVRRTLGLINY